MDCDWVKLRRTLKCRLWLELDPNPKAMLQRSLSAYVARQGQTLTGSAIYLSLASGVPEKAKLESLVKLVQSGGPLTGPRLLLGCAVTKAGCSSSVSLVNFSRVGMWSLAGDRMSFDSISLPWLF